MTTPAHRCSAVVATVLAALFSSATTACRAQDAGSQGPVSLRGAGSRANFGLRGVKVLLDGVPQTLPDGQSQLSNLELGLVDRVEVLTGSAGALYGNASGGVLAFTT